MGVIRFISRINSIHTCDYQMIFILTSFSILNVLLAAPLNPKADQQEFDALEELFKINGLGTLSFSYDKGCYVAQKPLHNDPYNNGEGFFKCDTNGKLIELLMGSNNLTVIPDSIGYLQSLEKLHLSNNQLHALPDSLGKLAKSLKKLYLGNNNFENVPEAVWKLLNLEGL